MKDKRKYFTVSARPETQQSLASFAKQHSISQGDVIDIVLSNVGMPIQELHNKFRQCRIEKLKQRNTIGALNELVKMGEIEWTNGQNQTK